MPLASPTARCFFHRLALNGHGSIYRLPMLGGSKRYCVYPRPILQRCHRFRLCQWTSSAVSNSIDQNGTEHHTPAAKFIAIQSTISLADLSLHASHGRPACMYHQQQQQQQQHRSITGPSGREPSQSSFLNRILHPPHPGVERNPRMGSHLYPCTGLGRRRVVRSLPTVSPLLEQRRYDSSSSSKAGPAVPSVATANESSTSPGNEKATDGPIGQTSVGTETTTTAAPIADEATALSKKIPLKRRIIMVPKFGPDTSDSILSLQNARKERARAKTAGNVRRALYGNFIICAAKLGAWISSGSSSMMAEFMYVVTPTHKVPIMVKGGGLHRIDRVLWLSKSDGLVYPSSFFWKRLLSFTDGTDILSLTVGTRPSC
jgi:hypothetical protein